MSDPTGSYETRDGRTPGRVPRWVKVLGIVLAILLLLGIVAMLVIGGQHGGGPGRHF